MSLKKSTQRLAVFMIAIVSLTACNDDFNEIGGSIVDNSNFDALLYDQTELSAHSQKINRIQSNGLETYALGVYDDPIYGRTRANVLTQLRLPQENPKFGDNPELDSVVLVVPLYSHVRSQSSSTRNYDLDSIFGDGSIKLSVFRSNYFLRDFDPSDNYKPQVYYSDDYQKFEDNLEETPLYTTDDFRPSSKEVLNLDPQNGKGAPELDTVRESPQMRIKLPRAYFQEAILDKAGDNELLTNQNFYDYFRGLYIKTEETNNSPVLSLLDFNSEDAALMLYYKNADESDSEDEDDIYYRYSEMKLRLGNQLVNVFSTDYDQASPDDDNLYVKGGQGSMAVIDLFKDENQLDSLQETGWLINEANLKLYVNKDQVPASQINPKRIFIYDLNNGQVLRDYDMSVDVKSNDAYTSRLIHLGNLEEDDEGSYYKLRITNYIDNIINKDSTNTKLGVVVSQNVNLDNFVKVDTDDEAIKKAPESSVFAPAGTVFYGPEAPEGKALKLEIYYTKPN